MGLIKQHINRYLNHIVSEADPDPGFDIVFNAIKDDLKYEIKNLLRYLDKVITHCTEQRESVNYTHIHLESLKPKHAQILSAFLAIKFFFIGLQEDTSRTLNELFDNEILRIRKILNKEEIPEGVKGESKAFQKIKARKKELECQVNFYTFLKEKKPTASLSPKSLFNLLVKDEKYLTNIFSNIKLGISIDDLENLSSYVVLNKKSFERLKALKLGGNRFLQQIENIIIYNSEIKTDFKGYNFSTLEKYNTRFGTTFKNLIIITTESRDQSFNSLKNKLETIESRFYKTPKYPHYNSYVVSNFEIDAILKGSDNLEFTAEFIDRQENVLWEEFKYRLNSYSGLEELVSLKMMNIYSMAFNQNLKSLILAGIFDETGNKWIKEESKEVIQQDISHQGREELKNALSNVLDFIIDSNWLGCGKEHITKDTLIIIPNILCKNEKVKNEISRVLGISNGKIKSWFEKVNSKSKEVLVLDYRDRGRFPFTITPNFHKHDFKDSKSISGLFLSYFFKGKYEWSDYRYRKELIRLLNHPLKEKLLNWKELESHLQNHKPKHKEIIYKWDEENTYLDRNEVKHYKVFLSGRKRPLNCYGSELFIFKSKNIDSIFRVVRVDELSEMDEEHLMVQKLEEFYDTINLAERLVPPQTQQDEIKFLLSKYQMDSSYPPEKLWKQLLVKKQEANANLYFEIDQFFISKNLKIVSRHRFEYCWLNAESDILIPRGKKNFSAICEFLGLPRSYYLIMRRIKNSGKNNERLRTSINNKMFSCLFNDGCFDPDSPIREIIKINLDKYKIEIDFEELGLEKDEIIMGELVTLVELLSNSIRLKKLQKIEITDND